MSQTETIIDEMPLQPILCSVQQGCLSFSSTKIATERFT